MYQILRTDGELPSSKNIAEGGGAGAGDMAPCLRALIALAKGQGSVSSSHTGAHNQS